MTKLAHATSGPPTSNERASTANVWCFQCGVDHAPRVAVCPECGVATVSYPASAIRDLADDDDRMTYELGAWNADARVALEQALHAAGTPRSWAGTTLEVRSVDEALVDTALSRIDAAMRTATEQPGSVGTPGRVGFDIGVRNRSLCALVRARLGASDIDHDMLDNGFLMVPATAERWVGDLIEALQGAPDEAPGSALSEVAPGAPLLAFGPDTRPAAGVPEPVTARSGPPVWVEAAAGATKDVVVSILTEAAAALRADPRDDSTQRTLVAAARQASSTERAPGFDDATWERVKDQCAVVVALIEDAGDEGLTATEADVLVALLHAPT